MCGDQHVDAGLFLYSSSLGRIFSVYVEFCELKWFEYYLLSKGERIMTSLN